MSTFLKKYPTKLARQKKLVVFAIFILFSSLMWFLTKLSKSYTYKVGFNINYENIPDEKLLLNNPKKSLDVIVTNTGFKIFDYNFFKKNIRIDLSSYDDTGKGFYISENDLEEEIRNQYNDLGLERVLADTIHIIYGVNKEKYVTVIPKLNLSFESDYELYEPIKITPDSVLILGPENIVDTISSVSTVEYKSENITENINTTLAINVPDPLVNKITFQVKKIDINIKVEKFSEKIIEVPITVNNVPDNLSVRTFPPTTNILVKTALKDLKNITASDFIVSCNYEADYNEGKLKLNIEKNPNIRGEIKLQLEEVEFLVKKQ